eukprot:364510-Chlamydomonas_euryale.AAC.5
MFKEAYAGCYDIIQTVATVAIPPPGGQIVGAALVITAMIIKVWTCVNVAGRTEVVHRVYVSEREDRTA